MGMSKEEFNTIYKNTEVILNLIEENTLPGRRPRCVKFIENIHHNIGVCIALGYKDMGTVRKLVKAEWKQANDRHNGIGQYYFELDDKTEERKVNSKLEISIRTIDAIINN